MNNRRALWAWLLSGTLYGQTLAELTWRDGNIIPPSDYNGPSKQSKAIGSIASANYDYYYRMGAHVPAKKNMIDADSPAIATSGIGELPFTQLMAVPANTNVTITTIEPHRMLEHILKYQTLANFTHPGWIPIQQSTPVNVRLTVTDPGFGNQTFFVNRFGPNMNIQSVWDSGINGAGVTVAVVDDGLDTVNADLSDNYYAASSYDFNNNVANPDPKSSTNTHGTSCAGLVGATANTTCGIGAAYKVRLAGIRLIGAPTTSSQEASALNYRYQVNDIYSNSWGPSDNGDVVAGPGTMVQNALYNGVTAGRGGKGNLYIFASGNGGNNNDHCGYDGYAGNLWVIAVAAISQKDMKASFSERCSSMLVASYGVNDYTTAVNNKCNLQFSGTSAAAPLVSGVAALILQSRPELTWRDVTDIFRKAAVPVDTSNAAVKWSNLPWGLSYSETYGYGKVDVARAITVAGQHTLLGAMVTRSYPRQDINQALTYNSQYNTTFTISDASDFKIERVAVTVWISSSRRGAISVSLTSPLGVVSYLAEERKGDDSDDDLTGWVFTSVKHWGEQAYGTWKLTVNLGYASTVTGALTAWQMGFVGENAKSATVNVPPLPVYSYETDLGPFTPTTLGLTVGGVVGAMILGVIAKRFKGSRSAPIPVLTTLKVHNSPA